MREEKTKVPAAILDYAKTQPGGVIAPNDFVGMGQRDAIDQALGRLTRDGRLLRLARGIYALSVVTKFGVHGPRTDEMLKGLRRITGDMYVLTGAAEANQLGFTTQVPTRAKYWTTGRTMTLSIGKLKIEIEKSPQDIAKIDGEWGKVIRAVSAIGKDAEVITKARKMLHGIPPSNGVSSLRGEIGEIARLLYVAA